MFNLKSMGFLVICGLKLVVVIGADEPSNTTNWTQDRCTRCEKQYDKTFCKNSGRCCVDDAEQNLMYCLCRSDFSGTQCQEELLPSRDKQLSLTLLASGLSLFITIIALAVLVFVVVLSIKKSKQRQKKKRINSGDLDKELLYVQGELEKMSPCEKSSKLAKFSKIIEATARAAIITYPSIINPPPPTSPNDNLGPRASLLVRRGSAPESILPFRPIDDHVVVEFNTSILHAQNDQRKTTTPVVKFDKGGLRKLLSY